VRMFGWVDKVDDTCVIATEFFHIAGAPLWPLASHLVDTTTMVTSREVEEQFLATEFREMTSFKSVPMGLHRRSVAAGYMRTWGVIAAMFGWAIATQAAAFLYIGGVLIVAGLTFRRFSYLRLGDQLVLAGLGAMLGSVGGLWVSHPIAAVIGALGTGTVYLSMRWKRATIERARQLGRMLGIDPEVIEMRHTLTERAASQSKEEPQRAELPEARLIERPSAPVVPIASAAPEQIEPASDAPRFLGKR
jgi:hypothetical protein